MRQLHPQTKADRGILHFCECPAEARGLYVIPSSAIFWMNGALSRKSRSVSARHCEQVRLLRDRGWGLQSFPRVSEATESRQPVPGYPLTTRLCQSPEILREQCFEESLRMTEVGSFLVILSEAKDLGLTFEAPYRLRA
jgi:hypothetical protein